MKLVSYIEFLSAICQVFSIYSKTLLDYIIYIPLPPSLMQTRFNQKLSNISNILKYIRLQNSYICL